MIRQGKANAQAYHAYMESPEWRAVKTRYRADPDLPQGCAVCGAADVDLHHLTYDRFQREELDDLQPLCRKHHDRVHFLASEYVRVTIANAWRYAADDAEPPVGESATERRRLAALDRQRQAIGAAEHRRNRTAESLQVAAEKAAERFVQESARRARQARIDEEVARLRQSRP